MSIPDVYQPPKDPALFAYRRGWWHGYNAMHEVKRPYTNDDLSIAYQVGYIDGNATHFDHKESKHGNDQ